MNKQNTEEIKEQVSYWRERLDWYVNESADKKCNEGEIQAIKNLLKILERIEKDGNYYNAEKSLKRFWETADIRVEIKEEMRRLLPADTSLAEYLDRYAKAGVRSGKKRVVFQSRWIQKVAVAASMVVMLIVGGTVGVYAQKEGFFQLLDKEGGKEMITTPSFNMTATTGNSRTFNKVEDIPHEYLEFMWIPSDLPSEMQFYNADISSCESHIRMVSSYGYDDDFFNIEQKVFKNNITYVDVLFDGYILLEKDKISSSNIEYYKKDNEGEGEFLAYFYVKNEQFIVKSDLGIDIFKEIVEKYIKIKML